MNSHTKNKKLLIITDSMLDGLANLFGEESNTDVEVVTFRGGTATSIADMIDNTLAGKKPTAVVIHCGTNSLDEEDSETIQKAYSKLINGAVWHTGAHIILSGIVHRLDRPDLNGRADTINAYLQSIESNAVSFLDHNAIFTNLHRVLDKRGLHLKPAGKRQIADNIWLTLNTTGQATTTGSARPKARPATWNRHTKPPMVDRPNKRGMTDQEWHQGTSPRGTQRGNGERLTAPHGHQWHEANIRRHKEIGMASNSIDNSNNNIGPHEGPMPQPTNHRDKPGTLMVISTAKDRHAGPTMRPTNHPDSPGTLMVNSTAGGRDTTEMPPKGTTPNQIDEDSPGTLIVNSTAGGRDTTEMPPKGTTPNQTDEGGPQRPGLPLHPQSVSGKPTGPGIARVDVPTLNHYTATKTTIVKGLGLECRNHTLTGHRAHTNNVKPVHGDLGSCPNPGTTGNGAPPWTTYRFRHCAPT